MKQIAVLILIVGLAFSQVVTDSTTVLEKKQAELSARYNVVIREIQTKTAELDKLRIEKSNIEHTYHTLEALKP